MIHLVTLNPALDLELDLREPIRGKIGEVLGSDVQAGGKALNIARFLKKLRVPFSLWLGTGGGNHPTHLLYRALLEKEGLSARFLSSKTPIRWNVVAGRGKKKQKYNHPGFELDLADFAKLDKSVKKGDFLVLTGRLPQGMNPALYASWIRAFGRKGVLTVVDTSGQVLNWALVARPWFFKVNLFEMSEGLNNQHLPSLRSLLPLIPSLRLAGLSHGAVTDGPRGAIIWQGKEVYWVKSSGKPVKGFVVGAGDGFLAGYLRGLVQKKNLKNRIQLACATATAVAQSGIMGFAPQFASKLVKSIKVKRI